MDPAFAAEWDEAEEIAADRLEEEARRRGVDGVPEPLVSAGKIVRDDDGRPIAIRRYWDALLLSRLKAPDRLGVRGLCASDCRRFGREPMQLSRWQLSPPGWPPVT